jgi:hypothetical protein
MQQAIPPSPGLLLEQIPDPQTVREHLGRALRTVAILRRLLPVAEKAARERAEQQAVKEGGDTDKRETRPAAGLPASDDEGSKKRRDACRY